MAALSVVFDSLALNTVTTGPNLIIDPGPEWGSQAVADALLTGQFRVDEFDQVAASMRLTRTVTIPLRIKSSNNDTFITDPQAIMSRLAAASRYVPKTLTVTPQGSSHVSTLKVFGGAWVADYSQTAETTHSTRGVLTLVCDWPVWGAAQNLGSSGAPLNGGTALTSPGAFTLSPSPVGDIPGDVILFVKNRSASSIRSAISAGISGDTTWVAGSNQAGWTLDTYGTRSSGTIVSNASPSVAGQVLGMAHFTVPTLPADRRFRVYLRASHYLRDGGALFRVRLVSGSTEVLGPWRTLPSEISLQTVPGATNAADMGAYTFPVGPVGALGAQSTTLYIEITQSGTPSAGNDWKFTDALFVPDSATMVVETSDTGKTIAAATAVTRIENDQAYDNSGNPAGGVITGAHIRTQGGRYHVYTSQGYMGSLDTTLPWAPETFDVWATYTPRYIGLA